MQLAFILILLLTPILGFTQVNENLTQEVYKKAFHQATINCEYKYWLDVAPIELIFQEYIQEKRAAAQFKIGQDLISVEAISGGFKGLINFNINGINFDTTLLNLDGFKINLQGLNPQQQEISDRLSLANLNCSLEVGREPHYLVHDSTLHVNMHPHPNYDVRGGSFSGMQRELNQTNRQTLVLFDHDVSVLSKLRSANFNHVLEGRYKAPLVSAKSFGAPLVQFQGFEDFLVSQAGHNRYHIVNPVQTIVFTGGNHNFCILNNTRRILHAFMENPRKNKISFVYVKDAVVVQKSSWLAENKIPRSLFNRSNLLLDVLNNMSHAQREKYILGQFNYIKNKYLSEKKYYFKTAILKTSGVNGIERNEMVSGQGEGTITIEFIYQ